MRKLLFATMLLLCAQFMMAQGYRVTVSASQSGGTTGCSNVSRTVNATARLQVNELGVWENCLNSTCYVYLQQWTGSIWSTVQSKTTTISSPNVSFTGFYPTSGTSYRVYATIASKGNCTDASSSLNQYYTLTSYSLSTPASASFKVDGQTVNSSTYLPICYIEYFYMTDVTYAGTSTSGFNYEYRIGVKRGTGSTNYTSWTAGTPPSSLYLMAIIALLHPTQPLEGNYDVYLDVRNNCNYSSPYRYTGKINIIPQITNLTFKINGQAADTYPYQEYCQAVDFEMTDITHNGVANSASNYQYRLTVEKVIASETVSTSWISGLPPSTIPLRTYIIFMFWGDPLPDHYNVWLEVSDNCTAGGGYTTFGAVTVSPNCKTDGLDDVTTIGDVAVETIEDWEFYPNPADDMVMVTWNAERTDATDIKVFDITGRQHNAPVLVQGNKAVVDVSALSPGTYVLYLNHGEQKTKTLIVK